MLKTAPSISAERTHLTYLAPGDVLKGRVEPTIWMRMCDAFAGNSLDVELVTVYAYRKENVRRDQIFQHYGFNDQRFKLTILPTPFTPEPRLLWYRSWTALTNFAYGFYKARQKALSSKFDHLIFYSRSPIAMLPYLHLRPVFEKQCKVSYFFETHVLPGSKGAIRVAKQADGCIVSSKKLARDMAESLHIDANRLHVAYLAANALSTSVSREEALRELNLDPTLRYVVYTGKLLMPEVKLMLDAAEFLANMMPNARVLFAGGNPAVLAECNAEVARRKLKNVQFAGFVPPARIALYQKAADVLMLYLVSDREIINYITPSKVFDYLQAGRPIIVSDYPILHEILQHNRNGLLVKPHDPLGLAAEIARVLSEPDLAARLSKAAEIDSRLYSWEYRTKSIWEFMNRIAYEDRDNSRDRSK